MSEADEPQDPVHDSTGAEHGQGQPSSENEPGVEGESSDPPSPEERRAAADRATRRVLAALLCLEAFAVLLVPRALAQTPGGLGGTKTALLVGFAVVLVLVALVVRRPWGIGIGSALQLPLIAIGLWIYAFFIVAAVFVAVWLYTLNLRHEIAGTPGGIRMLSS